MTRRENHNAVLAFTLVELLVTIAIIAILASLLAQGLAAAKESARAAVCVNNNHQLGAATALYATDNRNKNPSFNKWLFKPLREDGTLGTNYGNLSTGRVFPYLLARNVYMCPTDARELDWQLKHPTSGKPGPGRTDRARGYGGKRIRQNSYVMNCGVCHENDNSKWINPSKTILYHEANLATNDCSGIGGPLLSTAPGTVSLLPLRHNKSSFIVAGDLSVQRISHMTITGPMLPITATDYWYPSGQESWEESGSLE
jgi:prepilin-type N-terminal cleavage/methylation domain-containing protein